MLHILLAFSIILIWNDERERESIFILYHSNLFICLYEISIIHIFGDNLFLFFVLLHIVICM